MRLTILLGLATLSVTTNTLAGEDPYLWLEDIDAARSLDWVRAENRATADRLEANPLFDELHAQARAVLNASSRLPQIDQKGDWLYNVWRDDKNPRGIYRRTTLAGFAAQEPVWETVIDVDALSRQEDKPWVFKGMDCLPKHPANCLVRLSPGGGDAVVIREFNAISKTFVADGFQLPVAKGFTDWIDTDSIYVATNFGENTMTESGYPRMVKRWQRGTPLAEAEVLHSGDPRAVSVVANRLRSDDGDIHLITESKTFWTAEHYQLTGAQKHRLELPDSATIDGIIKGRLIVSLKNDWQRRDATYEQGSVLVVDPSALYPGGDGLVETLIEPTASMVVQGVITTNGSILVTVLENVRGRIYRYTAGPEGRWQRSLVNFPDNGSLEIVTTDEDSGNFFARYESFTSPPALYHVAAQDWQPQKIKTQSPTFDGSAYQTEQYFATSADGTKVPYFVVLAKDAKRDGQNPTHIFSYGGFRNALTPSYSGSYEQLYGAYGKLWLERGGIFVLANIRGGGEFGPAWHAAALKANRVRAFEDFEAVAEDLFKRNITSPGHLGIEGRSNGGLLVGATMTRRPELYGAVVCGVPLLDMKRYHKLLAGASWMAEYGDPDVPEEWAFIKQYSPYQNLAPGVDYPAIFFFTSTRDDRVHPGHARKMAARLKEYGQDVWYFENMEGGHGGSSTNDQLAYRLALAYTHLWSQLK